MKAFAVAARGKGSLNAVRRAGAIGARYGLRPRRMEDRLADVQAILDRFRCQGTLPVTAVAAARNPEVIARYAASGLEFAVHGYYHVDHVGLPAAGQLFQLARAQRVLRATGAEPEGFRAPYLRWNAATLRAVRENGFTYDSSQAVAWPLDPGLETDAYRRVLSFYGAERAADRALLPWLDDGVVRIPYCLPDDEAVVDRLRLPSPEAIAQLWLAMFRAIHERGELFTMGVHPERIVPCAAGVRAVLDAACSARPPVWIARLGQIAGWWRARATATLVALQPDSGRLRISVRGPSDLTILARNVTVPGAEPWADGYVRIMDPDFELLAEHRPFVAVGRDAPSWLTAALQDEGFVTEVAESAAGHACFVDRPPPAGPRSLVAHVEATRRPLLRLGRWPAGARSALALTGDVDALTLQDYALRFLGR